MATLTVNEGDTPASELVAEAKKEATITDPRGRKIVLRKPSILAQYRLPKVLGPELSQNQVYMQMVLPLLCVAEIDGDPVGFPQTDAQIEGLIQRLDEDGVVAVVKGVSEHFGGESPEAVKDDVKN